MTEGDKSAPHRLRILPHPFTGFGPRDSSEQEQILFQPSTEVPEESARDRDDEEEYVEGDIRVVVEVKIDGKEAEEEQEVINPRLSEEPSVQVLRPCTASNSLSSLGQPEPWPMY